MLFLSGFAYYIYNTTANEWCWEIGLYQAAICLKSVCLKELLLYVVDKPLRGLVHGTAED